MERYYEERRLWRPGPYNEDNMNYHELGEIQVTNNICYESIYQCKFDQRVT